jgi:hypothetical protein
MHRLIMNTPSHLVCDHINHHGLDNRKVNLRNCTISQNNANSRSACSTSSKYKGVSWDKRRKKWSAYIKKDSRQFNLGQFDSEIEATKAYDQASKKLHGQFAALNFPPVKSTSFRAQPRNLLKKVIARSEATRQSHSPSSRAQRSGVEGSGQRI